MTKRTKRSVPATRGRTCGIVGPHSRQLPVLERWLGHEDYSPSRWRIWINYNPGMTAGTYLSLEPDGMVLAVTVLESGEVTNTAVVMP